MKVSKLRARTSMRHLAGADIPRADTTSFGMRNALKKAKRASGGVCMGEVDGESKPGRLDKAVMRKCGGRIKKADGGETVAPRVRAPGELDEGAQRDYLKSEAGKASGRSEGAKWAGRVVTGLGAAGTLAARRFAKIPFAGGTALGVGALANSNADDAKAKRLSAEAKEFDKADTAEKRSGGRVRNCGGKIGKEDGGGMRLSADSEQKAKAADKAYEDSRGFAGPISTKTLGAGGLLGAGVTALGKALTRKTQLGKLLTAVPAAGATYAGAKMSKDDFNEMNEGLRARQEAKDIRAMKPIEGYEDRKRGGKVGKKS